MHLRAVPDLVTDLTDDTTEGELEPRRVDVQIIVDAAARTYWNRSTGIKSPVYDNLPEENQQEIRDHVEHIVTATLNAAIDTGYHQEGRP